MNAMRGHPENWTALKRQRAAESQEIFERPWKLVRTMRVQPMVSHADTQANADPIKKRSYKNGAPAEHEQGRYRAHVQDGQDGDVGPVQLPLFIDTLDFGQEVSLKFPVTKFQRNRELSDRL